MSQIISNAAGTLDGLDSTAFAILAGQAGGQVLNGGTAANEDLTLQGTAHGTKTTSYVLLQPAGGNVGIGAVASPLAQLHLFSVAVAAEANLLLLQNQSNVPGTIASIGFSTFNGDPITGKISAMFDTDNDFKLTFSNWGVGQLRERMRIDGAGNVTIAGGIRPYADGTTALTLCKANGDAVVTVDTTNGRLGVGTTPAALIHADQASTTAAVPVLTLDQADVSEPFIKLIGESTTDNSQSLIDAANLATPGAIVGWAKIYVEDVQGTGPITDGVYWVPFYATPTA